MLEPLYRESRRLFSSGDSVRCSFGLEPLLRSLLKLKPRSRSRGGLPAATAWSMLLMVMDGTDVGPPLGSPRLVVMGRACVAGRVAREWTSGRSDGRVAGLRWSGRWESRSNEWLASRGGDMCATAQRYRTGGVWGEIDDEKQGEGELQFCPEGLGRNSCRRRARCRVARGCPRGPEPSATTGWWLEALALDGTSSSANANRR